ncbi:MAG: hypothetical protein ABIT58_00090 [Ferruginibacter sp.]
MKFSLFLFSFFLINHSSAQLTTNVKWVQQSTFAPGEVIYYNAHQKLDWEDFTGIAPNDNSNVAALTVSGFGYNATIKTMNGKGELNINIYCYFTRNKSWVKAGKNTAYILNHEQHHFYVTYIAAVIFMDKLKNAMLTTRNYNQELARIYQENCDLMNKMQNEYDGQTKNGQIKPEQTRWNDLIDSRISSFTK